MSFDDGGQRVDTTIGGGWVVTAAYSRRLVNGLGKKPFVLVSASLGVSGASTHTVGGPGDGASTELYAIDLRGGVTVGKTFFRTLSPYAGARLYGGPIIWRYAGSTRTGTDLGHFQIAAGLVASLPKGFDAFGEVAPVFERGVTVGFGKSF
jgi:hypothetical protein